MSTATLESPTTNVARRVKAQVGDMIQYRYRTSKISSSLTTRRVLEVHDAGVAFVVEGFYLVAAIDVITVIPMHEVKIECSDPVCEDAGRCVCEEYL